MSVYKERLSRTACKNIYDIIDMCHEATPKRYKSCPWTHPGLNHGVDLLASDEALDCYMSAYGEMHVGKCRAAMMNFPFEEINGAVEIVDWGCGQGIGSATILEIMKQHDLLQWVKIITLIEPSTQALDRAVCNLSKITGDNIEIIDYETYMPDIYQTSRSSINGIGYKYSNIIHVFSNILDVINIDLVSVARMVAQSQGQHFVLCIGPKNASAYRIEQFCSVFGKKKINDQEYFSQIDSGNYARTCRTGHSYTCMTRCFIYDGSSLDFSRMSQYNSSGMIIYNDYDYALQVQNKIITQHKADVAKRIQNILSVDDIMYVNPTINEVKVDFFIVRPNKGIMLVNVFEKNLKDCKMHDGGRIIEYFDRKKKEETINGQTYISLGSRMIYQSPIDLINLCQKNIKDAVEELLMCTINNAANFSLIKKVVIFAENSISEIQECLNTKEKHINFVYLYGKEFVNDNAISQDLFLNTRFIYNSKYFDDIVKRKLASLISRSWHSYQEGRLDIKLDSTQVKLAKSSDTHQKISGVAGGGKTQVLAARAVNALKRTGGNILILTYNKTLVNYLKIRLSELREDFSWDKIDILHYHKLFRICASECRLHVEKDSYENVNFFREFKNHRKYRAIFVDEVQDYTTEWLRIIMQDFLEPNGELVVFGDPDQNVFNRPRDKKGDIRLGVIGGIWNKELKHGKRYTNPRLARLANSFQLDFLPKPEIEERNFIELKEENTLFKNIEYFDLRPNYSCDKLLYEIINIIKTENRDVKDYVILANKRSLLQKIDYDYRTQTQERTEVTFVSCEKLEVLKTLHNVSNDDIIDWKFNRDYEAIENIKKMEFTTDKRCIKISTIKSFKGWESPYVILILEDKIDPNLIYTAITRSREKLFIINIDNNTYDNFFRRQCI